MTTRETTQTEDPPAKPPEAAPNRTTAIRVVEDGAMGYLLDTGKFEHTQRIATAMSYSTLLPEHLQAVSLPKGSKERQAASQSNCLRVVSQALRWGIDPFAMIDATYVVKNKLGYEGKLVAAIINSKCRQYEGGLQYLHNTQRGANFAVVAYASVFPVTDDQFEWLVAYVEEEDRRALQELVKAGIKAVRVSVLQAATTTCDMWAKDPEQKLCYTAALKWARRYAPEIVMGVLTEDDLERMAGHGGELPPPDNLAAYTSQLKAAAIETTSSGPSTPAEDEDDDEEEGDALRQEPDEAETSGGEIKKKDPPGVVVEAKVEEKAEEKFALGTIGIPAAAIIRRIGKIGSEGGLKRVLVEVTGNKSYNDTEHAAFLEAAAQRRAENFGVQAESAS